VKTTPNTVLYALIAALATAALGLAILGASALGKRRERRAWLTERRDAA
jgi:ABC-type Fe3+ transport system permease subunit